ncbi:NAD-dependent epimerase/dehydratase family protein [Roseateles sp. SL47]|uniref:NAD-dependent epimerase/dehydratase family protein n=1 Tax=Roseateles sp. SL47 TaxID=2995138 RepID=UPI00226F9100|nr:NAD-dependent epimerase/dehydratase family protein [Roseateles sp. SL47]WAC70837.1 NAD-dependent epimerase/dehydratase family protein [Roseateles sp. SL47]
MTRVAITGASGFIGQTLCRQLLANGLDGQPVGSLALFDLDVSVWAEEGGRDSRLHLFGGSLADPQVLEDLVRWGPDVVFHLASVPGGAAERNRALGRSVNLMATLQLIEALGRDVDPVRLVMASSIAVYGDHLPALIEEASTVPAPKLSYGAHKLACETVLADETRRGRIAGCALRLPGVVARPGPSSGLMSAFMSDIFWALRDGQPIQLPVSEAATAWWISGRACARNLLHAATLPPQCLLARSVYQMPALHLSMGELVAALGQRFDRDPMQWVRYRPDPLVQQLFGSYPPLQTPHADAAGFCSDGSLLALIDAVLQG